MVEDDVLPPRRMTPQQNQETLSRSQFEGAISGWVWNPHTNDYGEDYTVSIYEDGRSTGLTFLAQLKSTTDWRSFVPQGSPDEIHYSLEVKDLQHWADTAPPVVVILWDVQEVCGFWQTVPAILEALRTQNPSWQSQGTATVAIPIKHTLDTEGLSQLRREIGHLLLPTIGRGKQLKIRPTFSFPDNAGGRASMTALRRAIEEGYEATVEGDNIKAFKMSPWWERAFGQTQPTYMKIGPSRSDRRITLQFTATGQSGTESIPIVLKQIRAGTKVLVLGNEGTDDPVTITLTIDSRQPDTMDLSIQFTHPGKRVLGTLQLTKVLRILREGGKILLYLPDGKLLAGDPGLDIELLPDMQSLSAWERLLNVLAEIQPKVARYGYFKLPDSFTEDDLQRAEQIRAMCGKAQWETRMTVTVNFKKPPIISQKDLPPGDPKADSAELEINPFGDIELFGVLIPMGRVRIVFLDAAKAKASFVQAQVDQSTKVEMTDAPVLLKYLEWEPPHAGPEFTALSKHVPKSKKSPNKSGRPSRPDKGKKRTKKSRPH